MIQMLDLTREYNFLKSELDDAISRVLISGQFINGPFVCKFEQDFVNYFGGGYACACASGTDALLLIMMALDIGPGDEVITSPFSFVSVAECIHLLGAKAVFVDIDPHIFNINPYKIKEKISNKTKLIVPVHLFGQSADMTEIMDIASDYGIAVIEDSAQSFGAKSMNKLCGTFGLASCFSFFPSKNLGCYGDGGLVYSKSEEFISKIRILASHGATKKYFYDMVGINSRLDAIQAAILSVKIKHVDNFIKRRIEIAKYYIANVGLNILTSFGAYNTYNQFPIITTCRDKLINYLDENGIKSTIYYPKLISDCKPYKQEEFQVAKTVAENIVCIPIDPFLTDSEVSFIADKLNYFFK